MEQQVVSSNLISDGKGKWRSTKYYESLITNFASTVEKITAKNTVNSPDFLVWKFCGDAQFPYQETRWNYGILGSGKTN